MNCQIIKINDDILDLEILSSNKLNRYSLSSIIVITKSNYLDQDKKDNDKKIEKTNSFGKIIELKKNLIKIQILKPEIYIIGKIINIDPIQDFIDFLPNTINSQIVLGEKNEVNYDKKALYDFIPTVQINQYVVQGQKIGYISNKISSNLNNKLKFWILSSKTGNVNKIEIGEFYFGSLIAVIDKSSLLLCNFEINKKPGNLLLKVANPLHTILLTSSTKESTNSLKGIKIGKKNLIVDINKQFLNNENLENLENTILIKITQTENNQKFEKYNIITIIDKYKLDLHITEFISKLSLEICEMGYSVIIISENDIDLNFLGKYRTINGEEVSVTSVVHLYMDNIDHRHFENIITID